MQTVNEEHLRLLQLSFIGKIIAGFTHEVKNKIAVIKESAGLMEDIIKFGKSDGKETSQYLEIIGSIEEQIEKSLQLFRHLNRFAHKMDTASSAFSVNESLDDLIALIGRFANQRRITIEKDFQADLPPVYNNPSLFQFLMFCLIEELIAGLIKNSSIVLRTLLSDNSMTVTIVTKGAYEEAPEKGLCTEEVRNFVKERLKGTLHRESDLITLTLPLTIS